VIDRVPLTCSMSNAPSQDTGEGITHGSFIQAAWPGSLTTTLRATCDSYRRPIAWQTGTPRDQH